MKICGRDITDGDLCALAERIAPCVERLWDKPTEFELLTAMALLYFSLRHCDIVVLEVGLGGRLDATNIIPPPEAAVLMNIGLEHTEILGDTLEKISCKNLVLSRRAAPLSRIPVRQRWRPFSRQFVPSGTPSYAWPGFRM